MCSVVKLWPVDWPFYCSQCMVVSTWHWLAVTLPRLVTCHMTHDVAMFVHQTETVTLPDSCLMSSFLFQQVGSQPLCHLLPYMYLGSAQNPKCMKQHISDSRWSVFLRRLHLIRCRGGRFVSLSTHSLGVFFALMLSCCPPPGFTVLTQQTWWVWRKWQQRLKREDTQLKALTYSVCKWVPGLVN